MRASAAGILEISNFNKLPFIKVSEFYGSVHIQAILY